MEIIDKIINVLLFLCGVSGSVILFFLWEEWKEKKGK